MKQSPKHSRVSSWKNSRPLMFAASSAWVALILVIFVFRGGGTTPVEPSLAPLGPSLGRQADELAALGDYEAAVPKYRAALEREPGDVSLRFALGAALSHLGRRQETAEQFQWVVGMGDPASSEVEIARGWLVRAGLLAERSPLAPSTAAIPGAVPPGKVKGRMEWNGADPQSQVSIALRGEEESNNEVAFDTSVRLGEPYEFDQVPPGNYQLTARLSGTTLWDRKVVVEPGQETVLDLTSGDSAVSSKEPPAAGPEGTPQ